MAANYYDMAGDRIDNLASSIEQQDAERLIAAVQRLVARQPVVFLRRRCHARHCRGASAQEFIILKRSGASRPGSSRRSRLILACPRALPMDTSASALKEEATLQNARTSQAGFVAHCSMRVRPPRITPLRGACDDPAEILQLHGKDHRATSRNETRSGLSAESEAPGASRQTSYQQWTESAATGQPEPPASQALRRAVIRSPHRSWQRRHGARAHPPTSDA